MNGRAFMDSGGSCSLSCPGSTDFPSGDVRLQRDIYNHMKMKRILLIVLSLGVVFGATARTLRHTYRVTACGERRDCPVVLRDIPDWAVSATVTSNGETIPAAGSSAWSSRRGPRGSASRPGSMPRCG